MFDNSMIAGSGQRWKALIFFCGSVLSMLFLIAGFSLFSGTETALALRLVLFGAGIFACSMLFACGSIRCPHCGARWVWLAVTRANAENWISLLAAQRVCYVCGR